MESIPVDQYNSKEHITQIIMEKYLQIASRFEISGTIKEIRPLGPGFINDTFVVKTLEGPEYILQRKNHVVFPDVPGMMNNIRMVTEHIKGKVAAPPGIKPSPSSSSPPNISIMWAISSVAASISSSDKYTLLIQQ